MKLYEHEAKELLEEYGLETPDKEGDNYIVKAQVLAKDRKKHGGIKHAESLERAEKTAEQMKSSKVNGHKVKDVLIEERINYSEEHYIAITYDTDLRKPVLIYSSKGGTGIENRETNKTTLKSISEPGIRKFLENNYAGDQKLDKLESIVLKIIDLFFEEDTKLIEINPLAENENGFVILDAMIELDDDAAYRHERNYPERSEFSREKTRREIDAEKIDKNDHRGIAGKYTELDGDIGMMLAGGGASLTNMDALVACGGKPANYTEYGGNPPTEKVYKLSKIIMSKPGLKGLLHVGGTANNTDIYRTMKGFCQALEEEKPDYPILVRRDGPNADKAFELLQETKNEHGLNMKLYRNDKPMTEAAEELMEMIK